MPISPTRYVRRWIEFRPREEIDSIPRYTRGIYALLQYKPHKKRRKLDKYDVVYVGMVAGDKAGIRGRLKSHSQSKIKSHLWTHFSVFKVWDNISESDIKELEGLFRQIYRKDTQANRLNKQKQSKLLGKVRVRQVEDLND